MEIPVPLSAAQHRRFLQRVLVAGLETLRKGGSKNAASCSKLPAGESHLAFHKPSVGEESSRDMTTSLEADAFLLSGVYWTLAGLAVLEDSRQSDEYGDQDEQTTRAEKGRIAFVDDAQRTLLVDLVMRCKRTLPCRLHVENVENGYRSASVSPQDTRCACCVGFAPHPDPSYPATCLSTLSAVQILVLLGRAGPSNLPKQLLIRIQRFLTRLQDPSTGAFKNRCTSFPSSSAEPDIRFAMCAVACFQLTQLLISYSGCNGQIKCIPNALETGEVTSGNTCKDDAVSSTEGGCTQVKRIKTHWCCLPSQWTVADPGDNEAASGSSDSSCRGYIDIDQLFEWLTRCQNLDGGFGCAPGCESHGGTTFCAVASLCLIGRLPQLPSVARQSLEGWLGERQAQRGGLNGRPGKDADSCYCWWILATASIMDMDLSSVYDIRSLKHFVLSCQSETGGISRVPTQTRSGRCTAVAAAHELAGSLEDTAGDQVAVDGVTSLETVDGNLGNALENETPGISLFGKGRLESHSDSPKTPDPFHTFFGLAGLSILVHDGKSPDVKKSGLDDSLSGELAAMNPLFGLPINSLIMM
ncbi:putative geranylgeranyl transferase type II beta subunit [Neospora caninum Liverpool]|uniref:Geranylgeranyl transferase type II subunit beta n=1 Tax=Neospora caninum (strain Liverpool) TaxID=572307 RepID=F0VRK6_NEOCL|nr:putative geranylgeranyl transferase type II beta subunit [Neospora caninum Liverpool]CBZ56354.1 putative geranylgeranyl transferase type II beta subunit [Neospora caninum Liverpool]CEL71114.1 TPA: geranylgeranyl transferase type II beta subunit,putative [Neospora caninum Liverpool]|eukprot:XP_003886379.1 putative geranylgeranyl transferase type II beta subunit [Neospora caninum Liverpool]